MTRETKTFRFEVKAVDDAQGLIEAYGSVFDNEDQGGDIVRPGAFKRTIQLNKSRVQAGKAKFLAVMLWQHNTDLPIGGWTDLKEDQHGLLCKGQIVLATQLGREAYELIKAGVINEFSIGYDIPSGGANYDSKAGTRNLTELRLWEVSPVTFAMNQEALLVGVKNMEHKSVCGDTSLPIGPRDASWDASSAHNQIVKWASKDDGSVDPAKMKKVHLQCDGPADKITSYGYAFCDIVNGSPQINVGGVKACAGALSGARGANAGDDTTGMQGKVSTLYSRINKKYPDDPELVPPWKGKARGPMKIKTFLENYQEEMCEDLIEDLGEVYWCALCCAILDAAKIGDTLATDLSDALDAFKTAMMEKWLPQALENDLPRYLTDNDGDSPVSPIQYGGYGYMSRRKPLQGKAGRSISASNADKIQSHIDTLHDVATKAMADMKMHTKAVHTAADDLATVLQGSEAAYGTDPGKPEAQEGEGKRATSSQQHKTRSTDEHSSDKDTAQQDITSALASIRGLAASKR